MMKRPENQSPFDCPRYGKMNSTGCTGNRLGATLARPLVKAVNLNVFLRRLIHRLSGSPFYTQSPTAQGRNLGKKAPQIVPTPPRSNLFHKAIWHFK